MSVLSGPSWLGVARGSVNDGELYTCVARNRERVGSPASEGTSVSTVRVGGRVAASSSSAWRCASSYSSWVDRSVVKRSSSSRYIWWSGCSG